MRNFLNALHRIKPWVWYVIGTLILVGGIGWGIYYWNSVVQQVSFGKSISLQHAFTLNVGDRAYYAPLKIQITLQDIGSPQCPPDVKCFLTGDVGAHFTAHDYNSGTESIFYLSKNTFPQIPVFGTEAHLLNVNQSSGSVTLELLPSQNQ